MKVFNLRCDQEHAFEGWFSRAEDFDAQIASGMLECPECGSHRLRKLPSAPRLNLGRSDEARADSGRAQAPVAGSAQSGPAKLPAQAAQMQQLWLQAARHLVENTEDVGERFAEEVRRIHYGEAPERAIRGQASVDEAAALNDEGIDVFSVPLPPALKNPIQ